MMELQQVFAEILIKSLRGHGVHIDPIRALGGLSHQQAVQCCVETVRPSRDILFHMVFWQDFCLKAVGSEPVDLRSAEGKDWPADVEQEAGDWQALCKRFEDGLHEAQRLVEEADLAQPMASWRGAPAAEALVVLAQHNSYHVAQIVMNRRAQHTWPPSTEM